MEDREIRQIATEVRDELDEKNRAALGKFSVDIYHFLCGRIRRYENKDKKWVENKFGLELIKFLEDGGKPSEFFKKKNTLKDYIDKDLLPYMYKSMDSIDKWQTMWHYSYRQSFRSEGNYAPCVERIQDVISDYRELTNYITYDSGKRYSIVDIMNQNVSERLRCYLQNHQGRRSNIIYWLAELLDEGDKSAEDAIEGIFYGDEGRMEYFYIRAIVMSHNEKMYEILGKTLLAAKLSEGLRQAICENIDFGTVEAFIYMLEIIRDNNLIRFASVKRAIMTFTGLGTFETKDVDRITAKELELIVSALKESAVRDEYLKSEDSMKIYIALWAMGTSNMDKAFRGAADICMEGTEHQRKTACFFLKNIYYTGNMTALTKSIVKKYKDDYETLALIFGRFMGGVSTAINNTLYPGDNTYYNQQGKYKKRVYTNYSTYFENEEECREYHDLLTELYEAIPKKGCTYEPSVFPWNKAELTRGDVAVRIVFCASALKDRELIIKAAEMLKDLESEWGGDRRKALELLLREPEYPELLDILTREVADAETSTRTTAYELLKQEMESDRSGLDKEIAAPAGRLPERCYNILEELLRLKRSDIREHVLSLLKTRGPEEKLEMLERLFSDGKEEKVTAGLDIIMQLKNEEDITAAAAIEKIQLIKKPTTKEMILIKEIQGGNDESHEELEDFYDKNAEYEPVLDPEYMALAVSEYLKIFPGSDIVKVVAGSKKISDKVKAAVKAVKSKDELKMKRILQLMTDLNNLIEDNKDKDFPSWNGPALLGNGLGYEYINGKYGEIAFKDMWDEFFDKNKITIPEVIAIRNGVQLYLNNTSIRGFKEHFLPLLKKMYGCFLEEKDINKFRYIKHIHTVFGYYMGKTEFSKIIKYISAAQELYILATNQNLIYEYKVDKIVSEWGRRGIDPDKVLKRHVICIATTASILSGTDGDDRNFPINYMFNENIYKPGVEDESVGRVSSNDSLYGSGYKPPHVLDYVSAAAEGVISKDFMYKMLMSEDKLRGTLEAISDIIRFVREADMVIASNRRLRWHGSRQRALVEKLLGCDLEKDSLENLNDIQKKKLELISECYENITALVLGTELVRGDTETKYSYAINQISRVYGSEYLVKILSALGNETLDRSTYYSYYRNNGVTKKASLSHLLSVCIPDPKDGDTAEQVKKLKKLVKDTDIKESRLIEAGLYSPEWLPVIGEYLGWDGFTSGCYYFMAHMNERFDDKRKAIIAKYTPLTEEELNDGAFDVNWFKEVYDKLGKKRFEEIYKAAKYISDGSKHSRARKYADAARGEMDPEKTQAEIVAKRNKDLLMAYALIPRKEADRKKTYQYIQKFLKESKQFGAQRRASEKAASEMAVKNLARVAGYDDETRFILKMEREISSGLLGFLEPYAVGEYTVQLEADDAGKVSIITKKGDKALKSVPAAIKKNEYIVDITEAKKTFTEQYRRTKVMMEESMESENEYFVSEILDMYKDPAIGGMIGRILFKKDDFFGFPEDLKEQGFKNNDKVLIAHPSHLFAAGRWHEFQKICYDKQIKQPFKQIFRELYVKTDEEKNLTESMRYAGNQINPKQTVGVLRNRRWIADAEDGLQKVYYKENIIATIYALADWFAPSDIEAPTLEWVAFYDRKTFEKKPICEIPDIIFSEVMRDVDLAVSVAHAGQIDPEMSHSTIEMRKAIAEFVVPMFKLTNVTFNDTHAIIKGTRGNYNIHLGSGVIHQEGGPMINVLPVHSQNRGRIFLPFVDDDPKTAEIMSKIIFFAEDKKIKDPYILDQIVNLQ